MIGRSGKRLTFLTNGKELTLQFFFWQKELTLHVQQVSDGD